MPQSATIDQVTADSLLGRAIDRISWLAALFAGVAMLAVALFMCFEAFSRHLLNAPTSWVLAVSILIFMWFVFLATPYGIQKDKHVSCDVFVSRMPEPTRETLGMATDLVSMIYIIALGWYGAEAVREAVQMGSMSEGLVRYPMWLVLGAMPVGMLLGFLQMARRIQVRNRRLAELRLAGTEFKGLKPAAALALFVCTTSAGVGVFWFDQALGILLLALVLLFWGAPISFALGVVGMTGPYVFPRRDRRAEHPAHRGRAHRDQFRAACHSAFHPGRADSFPQRPG